MSDNNSFPQNFLWAAATSSHQIEGGNSNNDWWSWEKDNRTNEPSGIACDSYKRFDEDVQIVKDMGHNAHRFSIEWSRVEPKCGEFDSKALEHYRLLIKALRSKGIEPLVTLHHFTNPSWMSRKGGWEAKKSSDWFVRYVEKVVKTLGLDVTYWMTINEQNVLIYKSLIEGHWPPGKKSLRAAYRATANMANAHVRAYAKIHQIYDSFGWKKPMVGIAHHFLHCIPENKKSIRDRLASYMRGYFNNNLFIDLLTGKENIFSILFGPVLKDGKRSIDFIGVNYYMREIIQGAPLGKEDAFLTGRVSREDKRYINSEHNDLRWEVYPKGLGIILRQVYRKYELPMIVTENGIPTQDECQRENFIYNHLNEVKKCIDEGVPVWGYCYWSLMDNFEWSIGYGPKFGLVKIDPTNQDRSLKKSSEYYTSICSQNRLFSPENLRNNVVDASPDA